ncbi:hypothetical protein PIB30_079500 [Stylosanthes scabra]|uniref:Uncharacterized protein n=1 Tax=Stylosanthes scabra TaxID=79078 RepID=A0ABU6RS14_9FABA|nr:hypothetical protein [Stylosanthes scabra]
MSPVLQPRLCSAILPTAASSISLQLAIEKLAISDPCTALARIEEEENAAEKGVCVEDDFADYWALVRSDSEIGVENDYRFTGNIEPAANSAGSCTGPPSAGN